MQVALRVGSLVYIVRHLSAVSMQCMGAFFSELFLCLRLCKPDWSEELAQAGDKDGCAESRVT